MASAEDVGEPSTKRLKHEAAAAATPPPTAPQSSPSRVLLVVANVGKKNNVRTLLQTAAVFGVDGAIVVGQPAMETEALVKMIPTLAGRPCMALQRVGNMKDLKALLQQEQATLFGIEIVDGAISLEDATFEGTVALMMGNEGSGMNANQLAACDKFITIPQHGGGTASLNVASATAIVLHHATLARTWPGGASA